MRKKKWFPITYLIGSVICFVILIGIIAWHYFHDHHGDARNDNPAAETVELQAAVSLASVLRGRSPINPTIHDFRTAR